MDFPFVGPAYRARSGNLSAQTCVNLYLEKNELTGKFCLIGTPGKRRLAMLSGISGVRAAYVPSVGDSIVVQGNSVFRVHPDWTSTLVGTISTNAGPVSIADNGTAAVLVDGPFGYVLTLATNALAQITDPAFYGADKVGYLDNYFVFNKPGTQEFYITLLGTTNFNALDFASAEGSPDNVVSLIIDHRELWLFGSTSTEVFTNTGNTDFPIERLSGAFLEHGCAAAHSVAKMDNTVFWLGADDRGAGTVWRAQGYTPARVSTHALEFAIASYPRIDDAVAYTYQQEGHSFYVLSFPSANKTWAFDAASNEWGERSYFDSSSVSNRDRSNCHMYFGGQHVVGDWQDGRLYALDLDYQFDDTDLIQAIRTAQIISNDGKMQFFHSLQIEMEEGYGLQTGQGSDPQAMLDWSDDGGHTWSNKVNKSMGKVGEYRKRVRWTRLGRAYDRIYRLTITDPVKRIIIGATLEGSSA